MKQVLLILTLALIGSSCYQNLSLDGFDKSKWKAFNTQCSNYRLESANHLIENKAVLLEANQNEIESLLGTATEHELYERNQKFFHYRLTPDDSCGVYENLRFLSIRFNAIGRANEVQVITRQ